MADVPRRDLKTAPVAQDAASGAKQASPLPPTSGASLDTFNTFVKRDSGDAAAATDEVAGGAAEAAQEVHVAAQARFEPAIDRDLTEGSTGATVEASSGLADRLNVSTTEMFDRVGGQIVGRDAGMGEEQDAPAAFRDSGRDALAAQVDDAFAVGDGAGASGGGIGRRGTPADLGVSGDFGTKAGLDQGSGGGLDLFDVSIPNRGVSGAANDLGLMQGIADGMRGDYSMSVAIGAAGEGDSRVSGGQTLVDEPPVDDTDPNTVPSGLPLEDTQEDTIQVDEFIPQVQEALESVAEFVEAAAPYVAGALIVGAAAAALGPPGAALGTATAAALVSVSGTDEAGAGKSPDATNPGREGSGIIGPVTPAEMAVRAAARERLGLGSPGSGDIDPTDEGNQSVPSVGPEPGAGVFLQVGLTNKATGEFLFGQPAGPGAAVGGSGSIDFGRLPGDMGNIDYGPDSTGGWSGNTMTENEADALSSFGGSGLSISDANRNDDEDEDTDDDDTN